MIIEDQYIYISPVLTEEEESSIDEDMALIIWKGVYRYEYMTDMNKFNENKLPPKKDFKSTLKIEEISDEEYEHAQNVFNHFEMKDLLDYINLYVNHRCVNTCRYFLSNLETHVISTMN